MSRKHMMVIPIFVPHKGCPFDCIYCDQKIISGQRDEMTTDKMIDIVETQLSGVSGETHIEIGFYGGSFTGIEEEVQKELLATAFRYVKAGKVSGIRLSTRPDYIDPHILDYLRDFDVKTIELGVQSLDETVLTKSSRGHSREDVIHAAKLIKQAGIGLGIQTMIGLPGDNEKLDIETAKMAISLKPDIVRIYPTLVIKGTYLEKMYYKGEYIPLSLDQAVDISAKLLELYESNGIKVIRIGLQPTDMINENMDVVTGPFHPAFRQLVESRLMLDRIAGQLKAKGIRGGSLTIMSAPEMISNIVGQKRSNLLKLKDEFGFININVRENTDLHGTDFKLQTDVLRK